MKYEFYLPDNILKKEQLEENATQVELFWKNKDKAPVVELATIARDFVLKKPDNYIRFGVYWWELKRILIEHGMFNSEMPEKDEVVRSIYSGSNDLNSIILAYEFKTIYDKTFFQGVKEFIINDDGDKYLLHDDDMVTLYTK